MNFNPNTENIRNLCRICFNKGDINIFSCKVSVKHDSEICENSYVDTIEKSFVEIMNIFINSQDLLNFAEEFPLLCQQCVDDLKFCYFIYEKIKLANIQFINFYQEGLNQCIEEEHLVETVEENEESCKETANKIEVFEETIVQSTIDTVSEPTSSKPNHLKNITLDKNDSFIVTQFVPETLVTTDTSTSDQPENADGEFRPPQNLFTVNLKAVEVQNLENTDKVISPNVLGSETIESAIYICQYCPQAFTKSEYLKTHIQKSHVCKFCTQTFSITESLFRHIREEHTENKCAICQKNFSSGTNLRHHIKRVHRIKLPPKVTLIDFIKSQAPEENNQICEAEYLEEIETADIDFNTEYLWQSDDCIEMLNENDGEII